MKKLLASQFLIKGAVLKAVKYEDSDTNVQDLIKETNKKQSEVLKLKEINQEILNMVVQL